MSKKPRNACNTKSQSGQGRKPNARKPYNRKSRNRIDDATSAKSSTNDVSWYTKYDQLAHDAANLPFAQPVGAPYRINGNMHSATGRQSYSGIAIEPGIMRLVFSPTPGISLDYSSPLNRSSINFMARIRSQLKLNNSYDHQDLTAVMLAIDSAIMFHSLGRRIYAMLRNMTPVNRYYPIGILTASGINPVQLQTTIQDFRAYLNNFAVLIEAYALPSEVALFKRHSWMCEGLYVDSPSTRAQTYMFVPHGFWVLDNTAEVGSSLNFIEWLNGPQDTTLKSVQQYMQIGNQIIQGLSNDTDIADIAGDLYNFYGSGAMYKLPYVEEGYAISPSYDEKVLSQIENATIVGDFAADYTPYITQSAEVNKGALLFDPVLQPSAAGTRSSDYVATTRLNMHKDSPSSDDVLEATRLVAVWDLDRPGTTAGTFHLRTCTTELLHWVNIFSISLTTPSSFRVNDVASMVMFLDAGEDVVTLGRQLRDILDIHQFDWAPRVEVFVPESGTALPDYVNDTWDTDNMTVVPSDYIENIHMATLFSLLRID